jgi:hypothetical protein
MITSIPQLFEAYTYVICWLIFTVLEVLDPRLRESSRIPVRLPVTCVNFLSTTSTRSHVLTALKTKKKWIHKHSEQWANYEVITKTPIQKQLFCLRVTRQRANTVSSKSFSRDAAVSFRLLPQGYSSLDKIYPVLPLHFNNIYILPYSVTMFYYF